MLRNKNLVSSFRKSSICCCFPSPAILSKCKQSFPWNVWNVWKCVVVLEQLCNLLPTSDWQMAISFQDTANLVILINNRWNYLWVQNFHDLNLKHWIDYINLNIFCYIEYVFEFLHLSLIWLSFETIIQ